MISLPRILAAGALFATTSPGDGAMFHSFRHGFFHQGFADQDYLFDLTGVNETFEFVSEFEGVTFRSTKDVRLIESRELRVAMTTRIEGVIPQLTETWNPLSASVTIVEPTAIRLSISASFRPGVAFGPTWARAHISNGRYLFSPPYVDHCVSVFYFGQEPSTRFSSTVQVLPPGEYDIFFTLEDPSVNPFFDDLVTTRFASAEIAITIIPAPGAAAGAAAALLGLLAAPRRRR